jgi:hypothetical protein
VSKEYAARLRQLHLIVLRLARLCRAHGQNVSLSNGANIGDSQG